MGRGVTSMGQGVTPGGGSVEGCRGVGRGVEGSRGRGVGRALDVEGSSVDQRRGVEGLTSRGQGVEGLK